VSSDELKELLERIEEDFQTDIVPITVNLYAIKRKEDT
jgi:hypothetical protein